jgi:hypothetical protein
MSGARGLYVYQLSDILRKLTLGVWRLNFLKTSKNGRDSLLQQVTILFINGHH